MKLEQRITALAQAIGADVKALAGGAGGDVTRAEFDALRQQVLENFGPPEVLAALSTSGFGDWMDQPGNAALFAQYVDAPSGMLVITKDPVRMGRVISSPVAMNAVAASATGMAAVAASTTAMEAVVANSAAISTVASSETAMAAVGASAAAMATVVSSAAAMNTLASSLVAMNALIDSAVALASVMANAGARSTFLLSPVMTSVSVPPMSSATVPSGKASASSVYSANESSWGAWRAFDKSASSAWLSASGSMSSPQWIEYALPQPVFIHTVTLVNYTSSSNNASKTCHVEYHDGTGWVSQQQFTMPNSSAQQVQQLAVAGRHARWRVLVMDSYAGSFCGFVEVDFKGFA